jgi:ankyrin repeat protein
VLTALLSNACQRGHTALLVAVSTDCAEVVDALVKAGADLEVEKGRAERVRAVEGCGLLLLLWWLFALLSSAHLCELAAASEVRHTC